MGLGGVDVVIRVVVHRVDVDRFGSCPQGWRWCVSALPDPSDVRGWLNAGWEPDQLGAAMAGEAAGVCALRALRLAQVEVSAHPTEVLNRDPCPAGSMDSLLVQEML